MLQPGAARAQRHSVMQRLEDFSSFTYDEADAALKLVSLDEQMLKHMRAKIMRDSEVKHDTCSVCKTKPKFEDRTADYKNVNGGCTLRLMCTEFQLEALQKVGFKV